MSTMIAMCRRWCCSWGVVALVFSGCGGQLKPAAYKDLAVDPNSIGEITILPAVDARIDKDSGVNLNSQIRNEVAARLENMGYEVVASDTTEGAGQVTIEKLNTASPEWLQSLGPPGSRWVMVLALLQVSKRFTFGSDADARVEGFLYDRETGTTVWQDVGDGGVKGFGLIDMVMYGLHDDFAIYSAIEVLLMSFPKRDADSPHKAEI